MVEVTLLLNKTPSVFIMWKLIYFVSTYKSHICL